MRAFIPFILLAACQPTPLQQTEKSGRLAGKRIAILATDGVEEIELWAPRQAWVDQGARTFIVSPKGGRIQAMNHDKIGKSLAVDQVLAQADPAGFDAVFIPGGVVSPDKLRIDKSAVLFLKHFVSEGKPIAAICHGPWPLIEAGAVEGKKMTSWPSLQNDLQNAGALWVDAQVVVDRGLVTSRKPDDLPEFIAKTTEELVEGRHEARVLNE